MVRFCFPMTLRGAFTAFQPADPYMRLWVVSALASGFVLWLGAQAESVVPRASDGQALGPKTTGFSALEYFQNQCARCHGDYGAAYGPGFGAKLSDERLREVVMEMAEGPGQAPLTGAQLDVQTEFHRALRDHRPFAAVVSWTNDGVLTGEALPESKLWLETTR